MTTCEICGRPVYRLHQGDDWHSTCHRQDPSDAYPHVIACWQRGYEREKARADALDKIASASQVLVAAAAACDREAENHPSSRSSGPLNRYMQAMDRLRKALEGYVP